MAKEELPISLEKDRSRATKIGEAKESKIDLETRVFADDLLDQIRKKGLKPGVCIPILGLPSVDKTGEKIKYVLLGRNEEREGEYEYLIVPPKVLKEEELIEDQPEVLVVTVRPGEDMYIVPPGILVVRDVRPVFYIKGSEWDADFQRIVAKFSEIQEDLEDY